MLFSVTSAIDGSTAKATQVLPISNTDNLKNLINLEWSCGECNRAIDTDSGVTTTDTLHIPIPVIVEAESMIQHEPMRIPDTSFNVGIGGEIERPAVIPDEELEDRPPGDDVTPNGPVTYETIEKGTRLGAKMLISSDGYSYNVKRENKTNGFIYWTCSVRTKTHRCPAWVKQYCTSYVQSGITHNHPSDPTKGSKLKVAAKIKAKSAESVFRPAGQIVKEVMREMGEINIDENFINADQFLIDDVRIDGARHLLYGLTEQLKHLVRARRWFIDGAFKVVSRPFYQLMSIHAFVPSVITQKENLIRQLYPSLQLGNHTSP